MSDDTILYTNPMSRGRIARWMLEETGIPYRTELIGYGAEMKAAAYRAINPLGKVPALHHRDHVITECAAICAYLADAVPEARLAPALPDRAAYYRWLFFASGPLEAAVINRSLGFEVPEDKHARVGYGLWDAMMDTLEAAVTGSDFVAGPDFTAADVYVGSQIGWGLQFGTIEDRPAFRTYWQRLEDRPARLRADALDNEAMAPSAG